jgi:predicted RNase H-like HicB family nuclease
MLLSGGHKRWRKREQKAMVMTRSLDVVIYRENDKWVAQALNVDVSSFGDTPEEARAAIQEALELYFEDEPDTEIPQVADSRIEHLHV